MPVVVRGSVSVALGAVFGLAVLSTGAPAQAQESAATYPSRAITFLVGFAAGGPTDVIARAVAVPLAEELGRPVVIENRPGGGGSTAALALSRAAPDGYTLGSFDVAMVVGPSIVAGAIYDPIKDFRPIVLSARTPLSFVGANTLPAKTVERDHRPRQGEAGRTQACPLRRRLAAAPGRRGLPAGDGDEDDARALSRRRAGNSGHRGGPCGTPVHRSLHLDRARP